MINQTTHVEASRNIQLNKNTKYTINTSNPEYF